MQTQLLVGPIAEGCVVRVVGHGTMQESLAFRSAIQANINRGLIVFDASECSYLDSTFLGGLIGIQKAAEQSPRGRFVIVADESMRLQLFSTSSLDRYFDFVDECPEPTGELETLEVDALDSKTLGRHIAVCHQSLADRGGPDSGAFRSIAERLSEELDDPSGRT